MHQYKLIYIYIYILLKELLITCWTAHLGGLQCWGASSYNKRAPQGPSFGNHPITGDGIIQDTKVKPATCHSQFGESICDLLFM